MSSLERVVERLVQVRTVECPYCGLRVTVKNPEWKTVKCPSCGHRINTKSPFTKQYVIEVKAPSEEPERRLIERGVPLSIVRSR